MTEENKTDSIEVNEVRVHQEQNWKLMTVLQIPWHHVEKLGEEDRKFLIEKSVEVEEHLQKQHQEQMEMQKRMMEQQSASQSPIIDPTQMGV